MGILNRFGYSPIHDRSVNSVLAQVLGDRSCGQVRIRKGFLDRGNCHINSGFL